MKIRTKIHSWCILGGVLAFVSFFFVSCKDDDEGDSGEAFDPAKTLLVSDFTPKKGGLGSRLVIYGENFGNDPSKLSVKIGGQDANVIGARGNCLYCFVPSRAYDGDIQVSVLDNEGEELAYAESEEKFTYEKKMLVTSMVGETYENNTKYDILDGPWGACGGLQKMEWFVFNPNNKDELFICGGDKTHRYVNLAEKTLNTIAFTGEASGKCNILSFSPAGELIAVRDIGQDNKNGIFFFSPESGFKSQVKALYARGCRAAIPHPVDGQIYTSRYDKGWIGRYDPATGEYKMDLIQMPYASCDLFIVMHPTGNYMYIIMRNKHIIYRADYDWDKKTFKTPYLACGKYNTTGLSDGVGSAVRMNQPQQGTFVKNPEYAGQADEYDFYFCDKSNHCVRVMNPQGRVSIYAGAPNNDTTPGYNDGDLRKEARFKYPAGIIWDEARSCIYVGDSDNHRIRKIALEE